MIEVGDRVRVVRIDPEDEATDLRTGDTGTVVSAHAGGVFNIEFDRELSVGKYDTTIYHDMRAGQLEKVEDKPMTKSDLKDGMICIARNGNKYMWLYGALREVNSWCTNTQENLKNEQCNEFDIMKIYEPIGETIWDMLNHNYSQDEPIWERVEPRKMTVAEIEEALGYPVEVVK